MSRMFEKPALFNYGWDHFWYDPKCVTNLAVREVIKGPFTNPKIVCSVPFVTRCQQDGTPFKLREGIPDCWAEYLTRKLSFSLKHSRNYELMHKEDANIVPHLRKYRLYVGQGIPDPWTTYLYDSEIFSHLKEHRKSLKNKREERCLCCEREYLFECPDTCTSTANRCSCRDCHGTGADFTEKCKCSEIFHNWLLDNSRRSHRRGSSGDCLPTPNGSHSETEDDNGNLKNRNKFVAFCECSGNGKGWECSASENSGLGGGDYEKTLKFGHKDDKFFKHQSKVYYCPYIKNLYRRKSLEKDRSFGELKVSKEIQTEIPMVKSSKTVQTEKPETKVRPKCTCHSRCFPCSVLCSRSWLRCPAVHSIPNFCCSTSFTQRPAFVCPYSFGNHFTETCQIKKRHKKKRQAKEKESDEGSNAELRLDQPEVKGGRDNPASNGKPKDFQEAEHSHDNLKSVKNIYDCQTPSTTLDHLKFLANYKLKGYLQEEISPGMSSSKCLKESSSTGSKFMNFSRANQSLNSLRHEERPLEKFKPFTYYRYPKSSFPESKLNIRHSNFSNIRRFKYCNQGTMTLSKELENLENDVSVEEVPQEINDSDEPKKGGFLRNSEVSQALGRRRKLLRNRKRRRKLVASILGYQDSLTKQPKRTSNVQKEVEAETAPRDSRKFSNQNFTLGSNNLNYDDNSDLRFGGAIHNSRYKQEVLKKHSDNFPSS